MDKIQVKRNGRQWDVVVNGKVVEGGFFGRLAAVRCADELKGEQLIEVAKLTEDLKKA